jgi:hypothetical protein
LLALFGIAGATQLLNARRAEEHRRAALVAEERTKRLERERERLERRAAELETQRKALQAVVDRLKLERRVAQIDVLQQHLDLNGTVLQTVIRFTEYDRQGEALQPKVFGVPGAIPHFDGLVIKFESEYVGKGDALRGQSLVLFRRVYGESQAPENGYWLGERRAVPDVYRVNPRPSPFEVGLWQHFWQLATDPESAASSGVRVAQGEAVYAPMQPGQRWTLTIEASGGLNLVLDERRTPTSLADGT